MGLRVVIAGGGTGGHLYPGIAVARELLVRRPDAEVSFAGTAQGIEARVVPREGFALDVIRSSGVKGKSFGGFVRGVARVPLGLLDGWRIVSARRPSLVIGVGGYSSGPVVLVAALRRDDAPAVGQSERDPRHAAEEATERFPLHAAAANQIQRQPLARHHPLFDAERRPGKRHLGVRAPRQQLARDGDARIEMAAGAEIGRASCRERV